MLEFNFFEETELALPPGRKELKTAINLRASTGEASLPGVQSSKGCKPREGQQNFGREGNISNTGSCPSSFLLLLKNLY